MKNIILVMSLFVLQSNLALADAEGLTLCKERLDGNYLHELTSGSMEITKRRVVSLLVDAYRNVNINIANSDVKVDYKIEDNNLTVFGSVSAGAASINFTSYPTQITTGRLDGRLVPKYDAIGRLTSLFLSCYVSDAYLSNAVLSIRNADENKAFLGNVTAILQLEKSFKIK